MTNLSNQPATKKDIQEIKDTLKGFATKDDLKNHPTNDDFDNFREGINNQFTNFRSWMIDIIDEVMGELKAIRENQEVHAFSHSRIDDDLDNHENRIKKLEKTPASA
ncbi:MAG: hypothetical protein M1514_04165 [Patescibacteria group bacterium]|nr:hypothetical protein [Patescibacteria group bacterium]